MKVLDGKVVLVTGATGGIGRHACELFAAEGARLYITDMAADTVAESVEALARAYPGQVVGSAANICDEAAVSVLLDQVQKHYGRLDGAFNNAGRGSGEIELIDMELAHWREIIDTNLTGTFLCVQGQIRLMLQSGGGSIVNNSSILGLHGGFNAAYTSAKHGVSGLTKSAAYVYAQRNIRVNAVCPGLIEAGMGLKVLARDAAKVKNTLALHPQGRAGTAQEVAQAALWLLSDLSSYVTGHMLPVDGGYGCI